MEFTWIDVENSFNDCATVCKKNGLTIFRIMESKYGFYADYFNNRLFNRQNLHITKQYKLPRTRWELIRLIIALAFPNFLC